MQTNVISTAIATAITADVQVDVKRGKTRGKTLDLMQADGYTPEMLTAPAKDADRTFYDSVCRAVVAGFSAAAQAMLAGEAKALKTIGEDQARVNRDTKCRENRKYWQQQIGSKIKDYRKGLERRIAEAEAKAEGEAEGETGSKDKAAQWRKTLSTIITQAQNAEGAQVKDLPAFIKDLESAVARITAPADK
jgi:hypothetical protein